MAGGWYWIGFKVGTILRFRSSFHDLISKPNPAVCRHTAALWYLAVLEEADDVLEAVIAQEDGLQDRPVITAQHGWDGIYNGRVGNRAQHPPH